MRPMDSAHSLRRFLIRLADRAGLVPGLGGFEVSQHHKHRLFLEAAIFSLCSLPSFYSPSDSSSGHLGLRVNRAAQEKN
jgi:hypothetical protein